MAGAMKRYREGLASRGVKQVQVNLPDAMLNWVDQIASEHGLTRSSVIEVLCRAGASGFNVDGDTAAPISCRSKLCIGETPPERFAQLVTEAVRDELPAAHLLYVTTRRLDGRPAISVPGIVCDWQMGTAIQGRRFNPLAASVLPGREDLRRTYVRWLAQTLAPERDIDAAFSDGVRQLLEETALVLLADGGNLSLEELMSACEALPRPNQGSVPGSPDRRVIDLMAAQHRGLVPIAERDEKALAGLVEAARFALGSFQTQYMRRLTSADDFLLDKLESTPSTIQISSAGLGTPTSRLAVMFITALIARRLQTRPHVEQTPLVIAIEDLGSLPRVPGLEEALSIGHRHGLAIVASAQSFRQVEARYGEAMALAMRTTSELIPAPAAAARP